MIINIGIKKEYHKIKILWFKKTTLSKKILHSEYILIRTQKKVNVYEKIKHKKVMQLLL